MNKRLLQITTLLVIYLMIVMPVSFAVSISNDTVSPSNNAATFNWATDVPANSQVEWGVTPAYGQQATSGNLVTAHILQATGLTPDTTYYYKIISSDGQFPAEKTGTFKTPDATPPPMPTGLAVIETTKTMITLSWDTSAASDFSRFTLYRNNVKVYEGQQASFADTNLSMGTSYTYTVSAWDLSGNEGPKATISGSTDFADTTPPIISNITLLESLDTTAKVSWKTDDDSTSTVYYRTASGPKKADVAGLVKNHTVQISVEKGKTVYYLVSSCNVDNVCANSTERGFIGGKDITAPSITLYPIDNSTSPFWYNQDDITLRGVTEGFSYIQLWSGGAYAGATVADENGTFSFSNVVLTTTQPQTILHIESTDSSGNKARKDYTIMLDFEVPTLITTLPTIHGFKTLTITGNISEAAKIEVFVTTNPITPTGLNYVVNSQGVQLTWTNNGASTYYIYRDGEQIGASQQPTFLDRQVVQNQTYTYQVSSLNTACSESAHSSAVSVITNNVTQNASNPTITFCSVTPKQSIQATQQGNFTLTIDLIEGTQLVKVTAKDKAGNTASVEQNILVSTEKPTFSEIHPSGSDWYYREAIDELDIKGKTTPNSTVRLWVMKSTGEPEKTTYSNSEGRFEFESVDFTTLFTLNFQEENPRLVNDTRLANLQAFLDTHKVYYLEATNPAGLSSEQQEFDFETKTCYSGNLSWTAVFKPEYQSPTFLSVDRLESGTERMAFYFELSFMGTVGTEPRVGSIAIRPKVMDQAMQNDKAYNLTKVIGQGMSFEWIKDQTGTKYYIIAKPQPIRDLTANWSLESWKDVMDAINNELKIPLEIEINYDYKDFNGKTQSQTQKLCREVTFAVDNSHIDLSKLNQGLTKDAIKFLNQSIANLDKILKKSKPIIDNVIKVCWGLTITRFAVKLVRYLSESWSMRLNKFETDDDCKKETKDGKGLFAATKSFTDGKTNLPLRWIDAVPNDKYNTCFNFPSSLSKFESTVYTASRYACDRVFCPSTPSPWTGRYDSSKTDAVKNSAEQAIAITNYDDALAHVQDLLASDSKTCLADQNLKGREMVKVDRSKCIYSNGDETTIMGNNGKTIYLSQKDCYSFENAYWVIEDDTGVTNTGSVVYDMKRVYKDNNPSNIALSSQSKITSRLKATPIDGTNNEKLFTAIPDTCENTCKKYRYKDNPVVVGTTKYTNFNTRTSSACDELGTIEGLKSFKPGITWGKDEEEFDDYLAQTPEERNKDPYTCCCLARVDDVKQTSTVTPMETCGQWNYRYSRTGYIYNDAPSSTATDDEAKCSESKDPIKGATKTQYDKRLYFSGRDGSVSFGQNHIFEGDKALKINPSEFVASVQTLCLTGLYKRLELWRNLMSSVKGCLETSQLTGDYSGEVCKELLSKYVCSLATDVIKFAMTGCTSDGKKLIDINPDSDSFAGYLGDIGGAAYGAGGEFISEFSADYGSSVTDGLFQGGIDGVAHKACMAAFGYEWDLNLDAFMNSAYSQEFATTVLTLMPKREFLYINPQTRKPVYEYRGTNTILAGCDIQGYTVDLVCVTETEVRSAGDNSGINCGKIPCKCFRVPLAVSPAVTVTSGGSVKQSQTDDKAIKSVQDNSLYMYDHVRVKVILSDPKKKDKCFPTDHPDGTWYTPLTDTTPSDLIGCYASPTTGQLSCTSNLTKELGFGNGFVDDLDVLAEYYMGDTIDMSAIVTKEGRDEVCLKYTLYKTSGTSQTEILSTPKWKSLQEEFRAQRVQLPELGAVDSRIFGGTAVSTETTTTQIYFYNNDNNQIALTNQIGREIFPLPNSQSGQFMVYIKTKDGSLKSSFTCGKTTDDYKNLQYSTTSLNSGFVDFTSTCEIMSGSTGVRLSSLSINDQGKTASKASFYVNIVGNQGASGSVEAKVVVGLYTPKTGTTGCGDVIAISGSEKSRSFRFYPTSRGTNGDGETPQCTEGNQASQTCKCGTIPNICNVGQTCKSDGTCDGAATGGQSNILNEFGDIIIYDSSWQPVQKESRAGLMAYTLDYNKDYRFSLKKPTSQFNGIVGLEMDSQSGASHYYGCAYNKDALTLDNTLNLFYYQDKPDCDSAMQGNVVKITMSIYKGQDFDENNKLGDKTTYIYVQSSGTTGVGLNGVCGPATSGTNIGKTGICKTDCANIPSEITSNNIADSTKKCISPNKCCIN